MGLGLELSGWGVAKSSTAQYYIIYDMGYEIYDQYRNPNKDHLVGQLTMQRAPLVLIITGETLEVRSDKGEERGQ